MMLRRRYCVKPGYHIRQANAPYVDEQPTGTVYQPDVYDLAIFLAKKGGFKYIVDIGAGSGEKLVKTQPGIKIIAIDYDPNIKALRKNLSNAEVINYNLEKGIPEISPEILKDAVVLSSDVIEHIVEPHQYLKGLSKISKIAPYVLVSTPDRTRARGPENFGPPANPFHVREWTIDELYSLFKKYKFNCMIGFTVSNDEDWLKATILAVGGTHAVQHGPTPPKNVLAIMTAYNEQDIVEQSIEHLLREGADVHVIENWSTDKTYQIVKKLTKRHKNLTVERFPAKKPTPHKYEWKKILSRVEEVANQSSQDWIIHNDADEFRLSPWKGTTLREALGFVDFLGYNIVDFTVADFRPVKDGYKGDVHPDEFFHDFEFTKLDGYFVQLKAWKNGQKLALAESGGHVAVSENQKVYPTKFISKHYPLRSVSQAKEKIFEGRKKRYSADERRAGWHIQYDNYTKKDDFIWDRTTLNPYTPDFFFTEYLVELISGIGIRR